MNDYIVRKHCTLVSYFESGRLPRRPAVAAIWQLLGAFGRESMSGHITIPPSTPRYAKFQLGSNAAIPTASDDEFVFLGVSHTKPNALNPTADCDCFLSITDSVRWGLGTPPHFLASWSENWIERLEPERCLGMLLEIEALLDREAPFYGLIDTRYQERCLQGQRLEPFQVLSCQFDSESK